MTGYTPLLWETTVTSSNLSTSFRNRCGPSCNQDNQRWHYEMPSFFRLKCPRVCFSTPIPHTPISLSIYDLSDWLMKGVWIHGKLCASLVQSLHLTVLPETYIGIHTQNRVNHHHQYGKDLPFGMSIVYFTHCPLRLLHMASSHWWGVCTIVRTNKSLIRWPHGMTLAWYTESEILIQHLISIIVILIMVKGHFLFPFV